MKIPRLTRLFIISAVCLSITTISNLAPIEVSLYAKDGSKTSAVSTGAPAEVQSLANQVIHSLSEQETFTVWRNSTAVYQPLGPGTHNWLVTLSNAKIPSGYLIIGATQQGGYALIEYGIGSDPLYNPGRTSLNSSSPYLEPLYGGPTYTQWKIKDRNGSSTYIEASSGNPLPDTNASWTNRLFRVDMSSPTPYSFDTYIPQQPVQTSQVFDPNDNLLWLKNKPLLSVADQLVTLLNKEKKLIFFSSGAKRSYAQSLPISGYQYWTSSLSSSSESLVFFRIRTDELDRYILLNALQSSGDFLEWPVN